MSRARGSDDVCDDSGGGDGDAESGGGGIEYGEYECDAKWEFERQVDAGAGRGCYADANSDLRTLGGRTEQTRGCDFVWMSQSRNETA
jgi:hypothetical protein